MSDQRQLEYLWIIEWNNPFAQHNNRGMIFYRLKGLPDVKPEDLEAFVTREAFPAVDNISTRAIRFGPQYLLKDVDEMRQDPLRNHQVEEVIKKLGAFAGHTLENSCLVIEGSRPSAATVP